MSKLFHNETAMNGKFQVMTALDLNKSEFYQKTTIDASGVHTHQNKIYKNLHNYWVNKKQIELIKEKYNSIRTSF